MTEHSGPVALAEGLLFGPSTPTPGTVVALAASACTACGRHEFPARARCPSCLSEAVVSTLSTRARISGFTSVNHPPPGASMDVPYVVAVGAFPEGVSVLGPVVGAGIGGVAVGDLVDTVAADIGGSIGYGYRLAPETGV